MARVIRLACLALFLSAAGCGYSQSGRYDQPIAASNGYKWHSLYRQDVQSIFVPIFTNKDFTRGVEFGLTKAVVHQLQANTPYRISDREHADTILEGEVVA